LTFFPAVIVAGIWAGTAAGAATLAIGAAIAAWAWLEPARAAALTGSGAASLVAFLSAGTIILVCIHLLRTAAEMTERARAEAALIAQETQHRVGNVLALVQAVARLSARHAASLREFEERFHDRLRALADAQAAAGGTSDLPGDLSALFRAVLRPFQERIAMEGPATRVAESDRAMLALLIHELGTNAVKHGALSAPEGRVSIAWTAGPDIQITWAESGGPAVQPPAREGFGRQIARSAFPSRRGEVRLDYAPAGLRCTIKLEAAGRVPPG